VGSGPLEIAPSASPAFSAASVAWELLRQVVRAGSEGEGNKKSAPNFSVQDASAALPQNCQTTKWIVVN
jgi:hypothetical protein